MTSSSEASSIDFIVNAACDLPVPYAPSTQIDLLITAGAEEIIIALDKQYEEKNDDACMKWIKKFCHFDANRGLVYFTYIFDFDELLNFKDSPIDQGKDTFIHLLNTRKELNYEYVIQDRN